MPKCSFCGIYEKHNINTSHKLGANCTWQTYDAYIHVCHVPYFDIINLLMTTQQYQSISKNKYTITAIYIYGHGLRNPSKEVHALSSIGIALTGLSPSIFASVPSQNLDFKRHMSWSVLCSVSSVQMRDNCWYWWNCWQLPFILSFHTLHIFMHPPCIDSMRTYIVKI